MSDERPPIFDDGGGLPDVDRRHRRTDRQRARDSTDESAGEPTVWDRRDGDWQGPNYLVRRAIVVGAVVLAIAALAILVGRLLGDDDDAIGSGFADTDWNHLVTVDNGVGTVVITDISGEETNRFRLGLTGLIDTTVIDDTLIATDADSIGVVTLATSAEVADDDVAKIDIDSTGIIVTPPGTTRTVAVQDATNERLVLVHGPSAEVIDTTDAETVPGARYDLRLAQADPTGRHLLVTDSGNFQSVLFSFEREAPSFFPGLALAVSNDVVVTTQNVGNNADVQVFDHTGERGVSAQTTSVRAGMVADGQVILVGIEGEILGLALSNADVGELGNLSIGTIESGKVAVRGDRLIVVGSEGTAIVDDAGAIIAEIPAARPVVSSIDDVAARGSDCLIVERAAAGEVAVIGLEAGTVVTEAISGPDVLAPVDGCRPVVPTSAGYLAINVDGVTPVTLVADVVALSPDGDTLATERSNRLELIPRVGSADADPSNTEPVDMGRGGRTAHFAEL